jgi:hypothetical protein
LFLGPKGLLRQYYANQSSEYVHALRLYFNILKSLFPVQWNEADKHIIFTNRGISAFLKLLKSILKTEQCPLNHTIVEKYLKTLKNYWTDSDWETVSLRNAYVGSKGWKYLHRDMVKVIQKKYKNFVE